MKCSNARINDAQGLEIVSFTGTISVDIWVNGCPKLTLESLLSLLNALADGVTDKTCTLGTKNLAKLSEAQKAIATSSSPQCIYCTTQ